MARRSLPADDLVPRRVRRPVAAVIGLGVVLLILIAATVMSQPWRSQAGATMRPPEGEAAGDEAAGAPERGPLSSLPGTLPGFSTRTAWTAEVAQWTKVAVRDTVVATRDGEGRIIHVDPGKGTVTHRGGSRWGAEWDGPWLTHIDGRKVLALASASALAYWPASPAPDQEASGPDRSRRQVAEVPEPRRIVLPAGAKVTWTGTAPLVTAGAAVWLVNEGALSRVPIPPKARALAADGPAVVAVLAGTWIRATATGFQAHAVPPPPGALGPPARMVDIAGRYLLTVWARKGNDPQKISLVDTQTAKILINDAVPAGADITQAGVTRQVSGSITAVGQVVVDPGVRRISSLLAQYTPISLVEGHVYAMNRDPANAPQEIVDIVPKRPSGFSVLSLEKNTPVPFALVTPGRKPLALTIAPSGSQWYLAAVRTAGEK
ncbi:MAG: hypothetical protein QG622_598 [Actinomycetota bacterium]|nr:hypothetical protein [Actinomycetota bacterium]